MLPRASTGDYGTCQNARDSNLTDTGFTDSEQPVAGTSFFYLVRGVDTDCGGAGTWGTDSEGTERTNSDPEACP